MSDDADSPCPECHVALPVSDPRFSIWCPACNWNVHPGGGNGVSKGKQARRLPELVRHERIFNHVLVNGSGAAPPNAALYCAIALATAVNLVTVALVGTGAWLLVVGTWPEKILGALAVVVAVVLRPRLGRVPKHTLDRATAPTLYAVTERITTGLGIRPVDLIAVDTRYGSGYGTVGLRRRRVLVLGLPLWETLTPDQRLALLGHELGHAAGRGRRRWIGTALDSLTVWADLLRPDSALQRAYTGTATATGVRRSGGLANIGEIFARPLLALLAQTARLLHKLLSRMSDHSGGQAEYRADETAARVASVRSAEGLLRALLLNDTAVFAFERFSRGDGDIWDELQTYLASVPETERARRLRLSELRGDSSGSGYPPTYLRIEFVRKLACTEPTVTLSSADIQAMDTELASVRASIADEFRVNQGR